MSAIIRLYRENPDKIVFWGAIILTAIGACL